MAPRAAGHRWEAFARSVINYHGGVSLAMSSSGHRRAGRQVDHLQPVTEHPELMWVLSNCRPAHGANRGVSNPCPQCSAAAGRSIHCNQLRGMGSVERARRIIAERIAEHGAGRPAPVRGPDPGRAW